MKDWAWLGLRSVKQRHGSGEALSGGQHVWKVEMMPLGMV